MRTFYLICSRDGFDLLVKTHVLIFRSDRFVICWFRLWLVSFSRLRQSLFAFLIIQSGDTPSVKGFYWNSLELIYYYIILLILVKLSICLLLSRTVFQISICRPITIEQSATIVQTAGKSCYIEVSRLIPIFDRLLGSSSRLPHGHCFVGGKPYG